MLIVKTNFLFAWYFFSPLEETTIFFRVVLTLWLLLLLPCLTASSSVQQSHVFEIDIDGGTSSAISIVVISFFFVYFCFVLILILFVATQAHIQIGFSIEIHTHKQRKPTISKFMHADSLTLCHHSHCLLSFVCKLEMAIMLNSITNEL